MKDIAIGEAECAYAVADTVLVLAVIDIPVSEGEDSVAVLHISPPVAVINIP